MKILIINGKRAVILFLLVFVFIGIISNNRFDDSAKTYAYTQSERPLLIIDPGHGGEDGGAVSVTGTKESEINLSISKKLSYISGLYGYPVTMTREREQIEYPHNADTIKSRKKADQDARKSLINDSPEAFLISIHQNKFSDPSPHGAQVLYADNEKSKALGECVQNTFISSLDSTNKRTAVQISNDIYLFKGIENTGIMVECGFISNYDEAAKLETDTYQSRISLCILSGLRNFQGVV